MKRVCSLCLYERPYKEVTKYKHGLNLCDHCYTVILDISKGKA